MALVKVAQKDSLSAGKGMCVDVNGKRIALFNIDNQFYAIDDECTHAGGSLSEGPVDGCKVVCPWHGAEFDVKTGEALMAPAFDPVKSYKVIVEGQDIKIEI